VLVRLGGLMSAEFQPQLSEFARDPQSLEELTTIQLPDIDPLVSWRSLDLTLFVSHRHTFRSTGRLRY